MQLLSYALLLVGVVGHIALWIALFNRNHALGLPRSVIQTTEKIHVLTAIGVPVYWACRLITQGFPSDPLSALFATRLAEGAYFFVCCGVLGLIAVIWAVRRATYKSPKAILEITSRMYDATQATEQSLTNGSMVKALSLLPVNQMTKLAVTEKAFAMPTLASRLDGLTIAHLSDLHYTGKLTREYFDFVVDRTNELEVDLIVITGDIVDTDECIDWIPETLGRLEARSGKLFILGNHDKRVSDVPLLRKTMTDCGFVDLGSRTEQIVINGCKLLFAGNERPWFGTLPELPTHKPNPDGSEPFRILLSHSPDQIPWAKQQGFDLMLAGHTHGGQIRLPVIGPIVAPSLFGVKYASGVFQEASTLVHVSRGISGLDPIRINCPPELARLTLRALIVENQPESADHQQQYMLAGQAC